jgi:glutathione synthase/RimK-type ligase-like ATP-grasp enzyme
VSRRLAILTPDAAGPWYQSRWRDVLGRMVAPLQAAGLTVEARSWTEAEDLDRFDLVMPLLVWGYHRDGDWQAKVTEWERRGLPLQNPPAVLRWNADKLYLQRLEQAGAPITPTLFAERVDEAVLADAAERFGTDRLIAKPRVSAGAFQTIRWSPGAPFEEGPDGAAMIQPYLPSIETEGEISLIYLGGEFSHAISKRPQPGDFRVQPEYDGIIASHTPSSDELQAAEAVLAAAGEGLLYARVDLVRDLDGKPVLMELELVEPDLYLGYDPGGPARFAQACAAIS